MEESKLTEMIPNVEAHPLLEVVTENVESVSIPEPPSMKESECSSPPSEQSELQANSQERPRRKTVIYTDNDAEFLMARQKAEERRLQHVIVTEKVIPTPDFSEIENTRYDKMYPKDYKVPAHLIKQSIEPELPDYDMDSEDEEWFDEQSDKLEMTTVKFEGIMELLENESRKTVITLQKAKALIKEGDDDLIMAVYDYWLDKRLKTKQALIPLVKTEAKHGNMDDPYIAFRPINDKMNTRKNRKNDESSYERMLKISTDMSGAAKMLEIVKQREISKRELLQLSIEVFEKRTQAEDFSGQIVSDALQQLQARQPFSPMPLNSLSLERRPTVAFGSAAFSICENVQGLNQDGQGASSDDDLLHASPSAGVKKDEDVYAFRRKIDCEYQAPLDNEDDPCYSQEEVDQRFNFYPTSINDLNGGYRSVGPCRRRVGRGGRIILDRMAYDPESSSTTLQQQPHSSSTNETSTAIQPEIKQGILDSPSTSEDCRTAALGCWHHFRPKTPDLLDKDEGLSESESLVDEPAEEPGESSLEVSTPLLQPSYHLGLVVSSGDSSLIYPLETLLFDPPLHQNELPSHMDTPGDNVVLDEHTSELENTNYLMELTQLTNEYLNVDGDEPTSISLDLDNTTHASGEETDGEKSETDACFKIV